MKNQNKLTVSILLVMTLLVLPMIQAIELNTTDIITSTGNINLSISTPSIFFDQLVINKDNVSFTNLRSSSLANEWLSFTLTDAQNKTSSDMPNISSSLGQNSKTWVITNNLTNVTATVNLLSSSIWGGCNTKFFTLNGVTQPYTCSGAFITTTINLSDTNTLYAGNYLVDNTQAGVCSNIFAGFLAFNPWVSFFAVLGIFVIISIISIVVFVVNGYGENRSTGSPNLNLDANMLKYVFYMVLVIAILLIMALLVIQSLCSFS